MTCSAVDIVELTRARRQVFLALFIAVAVTLHVFETLLPYAMALGVAEKWAKQFEGIYATGGSPGWYVGGGPHNAGFSTTAFHNSLQTSMTSAAQSMRTAPRSSGSSGSGGGGFSGGGGGGGGGGSW